MNQKPRIASRNLQTVFATEAYNQYGEQREVSVAGEAALTICVDGKEVVTLMTLGAYPAELVIGYLLNQKLIEDVGAIAEVKIDWERERADVVMRPGQEITDWEDKLKRRIVTSGCGQGTIFSCTLDKLYQRRLPNQSLRQSILYALLHNLAQRNEVYQKAGAVHGCALCENDQILVFIEDVGRHNAMDAIAGLMGLKDISPEGKIFYTTGRLTSEIVMKLANMEIPVLVSRSGVTHMGLELARDLNVTMIARAKVHGFLIYNNPNNLIYDAMPKKKF